MQIVMLGSINLDETLQVPHLPAKGETLIVAGIQQAVGGKGANQAVAAVRGGGQVSFYGRVGDDPFGAQLKSQLQATGVDVAHLQTTPATSSGRAFIVVDHEGNNTISVISGANALVKASDVTDLDSADVVMATFETPIAATLAAFKQAKRRGATTILNPAPAMPEVPEALWTLSDYVIPNETETQILTGINPNDGAALTAAATWFINRGVKTVLITLGDRGVYYQVAGQHGLIPAFKVQAVDTTAAGDTFIGHLVAKLDWPLPQAIEFASAASALAVQQVGAQPAIPTDTAVTSFLKEQGHE